MSKYVFTFFKRVADPAGHEIEAPQDVIELSSTTLRDAVEAATHCFAEKRRIPYWSLHADRLAISLRG